MATDLDQAIAELRPRPLNREALRRDLDALLSLGMNHRLSTSADLAVRALTGRSLRQHFSGISSAATSLSDDELRSALFVLVNRFGSYLGELPDVELTTAELDSLRALFGTIWSAL